MPTLDWIGKAAVINHHQQVPYRLFHCDTARSVGEAGEGNLLIEGDNLQALKALLPYYRGQVKCIYIDPPYNTGNESWVYNDNVNSAEMRKWLGDVVGGEAEDLSRHDKWLCMIYPRLHLLRELLRDDGAIFVSIDDTEVAYLRCVLDEIFGRANFIAHIVWQKRYVSNVTAQFLSDMHDHILMYARQRDKITVRKIPRSDEQLKDYKNPDDDPRGPWRAQDLSASKPYSAGLFTITSPAGLKFDPPPKRFWRCSKRQYDLWAADNRIWFGKSGTGRPMLKAFLSEVQEGLTPNTWWSYQFAGHNKEATLELKAIFGGDPPFDTPKPVKLVRRILELFTGPNSLVLDSFAGSATTAHAVLQINAEAEDSNRRFILIEMEPGVARDVAAERLRRVIAGYGDKQGLGGSFRYCTLGDPLFDANGKIRETVKFGDLARHIFFTETGEPLPKRANGQSPLIGEANGTGYYLLWDRQNGGGILDGAALRQLPKHDGPKVVYGNGCRFSPARLKRESIVFKQIPYEIKES